MLLRQGDGVTSFPVPEPDQPFCSLLANPDNLDALRRVLDGLVGASVPVVGLAALMHLDPLVGTDGLSISRRSP